MEALKNWIISIATISILMIIFDLIIPDGKMRKFVRLISGFVIMFALLNPVLIFLGKGVNSAFAGWDADAVVWKSQVNSLSINQVKERDKQTLELYRSMLIDDIKIRLEGHYMIDNAQIDAVLNENSSSDRFGEIRKIYIKLAVTEDSNISKVDRLKGKSLSNTQSVVEKDIREELARVFVMDINDIIVQFIN